MVNNAINTNPHINSGGAADIAITTHGSNVYWAVCAIMTVATLAFIGLGYTKPRTHRVFHYITAAITMVAAIAYFTMGANLGWTPIEVEYKRSNPRVSGLYREIFYVRYIDWIITTPLLLMDLLLTAGLPWPTILFTILVNEVMIVTGLVGALVRSEYKWGFFTFGCVALLYVIWVLGWVARKHASRIGKDVASVYLRCGVLTMFLWFLYPIAWGLSEGGNVIAPDSEAAFYSVLDVLAKPVFGILLLLGHNKIDPGRLGLRIRDYDDHPIQGSTHAGPHSGEKHGNGVGHDGTDVAGTNRPANVVDTTATGTGSHV
ncbi:MAG: ion channel activity [Caeruleum heppii]|nr:MAG: ion channel activity [Caeruleum heppii]